MALSDNARIKLNVAAADISVGDELLTKMADKTVAQTFAGAQTFSGTVTLSGAVAHTGTTIGFFNIAATTRPTAYTQTYATADKTHANPTGVSAATTGATQTTPWGYTTAAQANDIVTELNAVIVDLADIKQLVNSVIDDLQLLGILQ